MVEQLGNTPSQAVENGGDQVFLPLRIPRLGGGQLRMAEEERGTLPARDSALPTGVCASAPEDALDTACGLYLGDPTAWI